MEDLLLYFDKEKKIFYKENEYVLNHSVHIFSIVDVDAIDKIFVVTGPGSYINTRKAIALAEGLCFGSKRSLYGINLLVDYLKNFGEKTYFVLGEKVYVYNDIISLIPLKDFTPLVGMVGNDIIDCSIENIWKFSRGNYKFSYPKVLYIDKFS
jgi:hypothetical protein